MNPSARILWPRRLAWLAPLAFLLLAVGCRHSDLFSGDYMYVGVPKVVLRDRVAAIFNPTGEAQMGEKVYILDRQKRFVRIRTARKQEGWVELRSLISREVFDGFEKLAQDNQSAIVQGHGSARAELNIHLTPARDSEKLYQLAEGERVEILKRAIGERLTPEQIAAKQAAKQAAERAAQQAARDAKKKSAAKPAAKPAETQQEISRKAALAKAQQAQQGEAGGDREEAQDGEPAPPPVKQYDDFWLVRSKDGHVGWVLARMIDIDVPLEVAQYAEGQTINGAYPLNTVHDEEQGDKQQWLLVLNKPIGGLVYDFDQARVFTWNLKRHRYETGYREKNFKGYLPVRVGTQDFGRDGGVQPVFFLRKENTDTTVTEREYRVIGNVVRQVPLPDDKTKMQVKEDPNLDKDKDKDKGKKGAKVEASRAKPPVAQKKAEKKNKR